MDLREIQDWIVAPRLAQVEGVADVVTFGGLVKQYHVEVDPFALEKYKLTVAQVAHAVETEQSQRGRGARQQRPTGDGRPRRGPDPVLP